MSEKVKKWRRKTKQRIIDSMGGKCQCCDYNRCNDALELHHIDPTKKEISFGGIRANPKSWLKIVKELRECILVCAICHREIHAGIRDLPQVYQKFDEDYLDYKTLEKEDMNSVCPVCGKLKNDRNVTCSRSCAAKLSGSITWDDQVLTDMYLNKNTYEDMSNHFDCSIGSISKRLKKLGLIQTNYYFIPKDELEKLLFQMPQTKIAKKYNCSLKIIRNHVKKYKLQDLLPKNYWQTSKNKKPNEEQLKKLIWEIPTEKIGRLYGYSDKAVEKWCKKYNIEKPPRGYWQKRRAGITHEDALNPPEKQKTNPINPLTKEEVDQINILLAEGNLSLRKIGERYNRGHMAISKIRDGITYQ